MAEGGGDAEDAPKLKFRNYQPKGDELKDGVVPQVKISADKELEKMARWPPLPLRQRASASAAARALCADGARRIARPRPAPRAPARSGARRSPVRARSRPCARLQVQTSAEIQLDVAPKKANWDLKQHIAKKLEKLERRTQQAIVEMIKEKVAQDGDAEEQGRLLAAGVAGTGKA